MVIGEDSVVPRGVSKAITDPEVLKREEKRIPDQNPPLHEPGTASLPGALDDEPVLDAPIEPEPEIDQVDVSREPQVREPPQHVVPAVDPEGEAGISPEPDRSPGAPSEY